MDSLISGIIDCVARPSTTDSPVRVIRKSASESPTCASTDLGLASWESSAHLGLADSDLESSAHMLITAPPSHLHGTVSLSSTRLMFSGEATPLNSVLTAEGIIMGDEKNFTCESCGECNSSYDANCDDGTVTSESIDSSVVRQFEAAFATFLYKNPAFSAMSHTTLQKLRSKLLKESARNILAEDELRRQLSELRESTCNRELNLQRELLVVTRAKAAREAEYIINIQKTRQASMMLDANNGMVANCDTIIASPPRASVAMSHPIVSASFTDAPTSSIPAVAGSESFEEFRREIQKTKMDQIHILAEMEKIKMQMAQEHAIGML